MTRSEYTEDRDDDLRREAINERRRQRRLTGCLCGYPDWPGSCPGWRSCPVHGENALFSVLGLP